MIRKSKKLKKLLLMILLMLIVFNIVQPILAVSGSGQWVGGQFGSFIYTTDSNSKEYGVLMRVLVNYSTRERITAFCVEDGVGFNTGTIYSGTYYTPTSASMKKACKIAYFGWYNKYGDYVIDGGVPATAKQDYVFTQQYIWEVLGQSSATFVNSNIQQSYIAFKNEIEQKISNMELRPSFNGTTISLRLGETTRIDDTNGVLAKYNSLDVTTDGIRVVHNIGENYMTFTATNDCAVQNYRISDEMFKNWGMIKEETRDYDTSIYFEFSSSVQNQLYSMNYNDPVSLSVSLEIESNGKLELTKLDTNGNLIDGAVFNVKGTNYDKDVVISNGKVTLENLTIGTYTIKEKTAPYGYTINAETYTVEVRPNETATQSIINEEVKGKFTLTKTDEKGTSNLKGVTYRIWNDNGYDETLKTDNNGTITIENLKLGKYYYQEIETINGYVIDDTIYEFTLEYKDQNTKIVSASAIKNNKEATGTFTLIKKNAEGTLNLKGTKYRIWNDNGYEKEFITDANGKIEVTNLKLGKYYYQEIEATYGYLLDNNVYTFELKYKDQNTKVVYADATKTNEEVTGTFTLTKTNETGTANLKGVTYRIWSDNGYEKEFVTDANGKIEVTNLKLGKYYYQEIETINGYIIDNTIYEFTLEYKDQNTKVVYANATRTNEEVTGTFTLIKKNSNQTINIEGTKYRIWNDNGYNKEFTTNKDGKIEVAGLKLGKYNYQEIQASTGYIIDNQIYTFELKYKDQNTKVVYANVTRTNEEVTGTFTLIKKNSNQTENIEGTKYRIWNDNGYDKEFTTDKDGKIEVTGLKLGKYNYQEIQASTGYIIDNQIYTFELKYKDQNTKVVYANAIRTNEEVMGTFTLTKKNEDNSKNLSGVKYKVWNDNGYEKEFVTDENGKIEIEDLKLGKYYYQEIQTIYGYVIDNNIYTFELKYKDQNTKIVYESATRNNKETTGTFTLTKKNEDSSANLEGTTYRVWSEENNYNKTFETDKNGQIIITGLKLGKYNYQEIKAMDGYLIDNTVYTFELKYKDQNTSIVYANEERTNKEPTGTISIVKKDIETGSVPQGNAQFINAKYEVYAVEDIYNKAKTKKIYSKGDLVATRTMNEKGETEDVTNLPLGKYLVKETVSPIGYLLDIKEYEVNLQYKDQNTEIISNSVTSNETVKKMQVHIFKSGIKVNSGLVNGLEGAEFNIKLYSDVEKALEEGYTYTEIWNGIDEYGNKVEVDKNRVAKAQIIAPTYETVKTDENGNAYTNKNLPYGKYIVKETYTPEDYESAEDFTFSITQDESEVTDIAQKIKHLVINNEQLETYVKIVKEDLKTGKTVTLNSATFEIKATKDIYDRGTGKIIYKKGETITQKIGSTTYTTFTTNADNIVVPDNSYNTNNDDKGTVTTPLLLPVGSYELTEIKVPEGFLQLEKPVTFTVKGIRNYDTDEDGDYILTVKVKNEQPTGNLIINKTISIRKDIDKSLIDISDLSEIQFKLTAKEDIINVIDGSVIYKKGTEINTYNLDKKGNLKVTELPLGVYEIQEVKTLQGLILNTTKYEIKFTQEDLVTKVYEIQKDITNDTTLVEFSKTDITGDKELVGARLTVIDENDNIIDSWISTEKTHKIEGLVVGKEYTLIEEIAPDGYVVATEIKFTIKDTSEIQKVNMKDKIVEITKTDITNGKELEGAELEVTDEDGNTIDKWTSTNEPHQVKGLEEGKTYILKETTAPYGYEITEEIEFTVTEDKETQKIEMKDMPILKNIKVLKIDSETKEIIKSKFTFGIFEDEECTKIITEVTGNKKDGTALFENLRYGTYYIKELKAPNGYELSDKVVKIEINDKGVFANEIELEETDNAYTFEYENQKIETPKTGDERNIKLWVILFITSMLSLLSLGIYKVIKKRKDK